MVNRGLFWVLAFLIASLVALPFNAWATDDTNKGYDFLEKNEFDSARVYIKKALAKKPSDFMLQLANAKLTVNGAAARLAYKKIIAQRTCPDSISSEANYRLACLYSMSASYAKAEAYSKDAWKTLKKPLYLRFYARCARANKHDSLSQALLRDTVSLDATPVPRHDSLKQSLKPQVSDIKQVFYIQAGAFGEMENAQTLRTELKEFCANVVVVAGVVNDKNIYRVRLGAFDSKEAAQAFGDSTLAKRNLSFRIVEE